MMTNERETATAADPLPGLPRGTCEEHDVDADAVNRLAEVISAPDIGAHSLMVLRHGAVIAERWWQEHGALVRHPMYSVTKSFTSTAIGMAVDAGLLSIDEPLLAFFPTYATPSVRANVAGMTPRHLLTMSSGIREDLWTELRERPSEDWVRRVLETPLVDAPGTRFRYSSLNSHMLAAALANRTGLSPREFLTPRLFEPLGMVPPPWDTDGRGISEGGRGMWLRTEELAALGQFYLNDGVWGGRRLLSGAWIQQATSARIATASPDVDWAQGYGFQFWRGTGGTFRADGAYGQFSVVDRARDAVVAVTAHSERTAVILGAIHAFLQHHDPGHHDPGHHAGPQHIELQHDK